MATPGKLGHNASVYLDALRLLASASVFLTYTKHILLPTMLLGPLGWSREAVTIFFVLSGFVISYVTTYKETRRQDYIVARASRIFPVALLAILITVLADFVGVRANATFYEIINQKFDGFYVPVSFSAILSYITFTNQIWFTHTVLGSDEPYWSLGFEVQYYIFFFFVVFFTGYRRAILIVVWALCCGPNILLYLPIWLMGVLARKIVLDGRVQSLNIAISLFVASIILFAMTRLWLGSSAGLMYKVSNNVSMLSNFVYFSMIGVSVMFNIIGVIKILDEIPPVRTLPTRILRWLATGSFTLYLVHLPILMATAAIIKSDEQSFAVNFGASLAVFALCYLLAEIAERRKKVFADFLRSIGDLIASKRASRRYLAATSAAGGD